MTRILVVQMGHSGRTSGATGAPGEMAFTEAVGAACVRLLNQGGWSVRAIPADPAASAYRGDAFVAVHADGSTNPAIRGASVGYQTAQGGDLAHAWMAAYARRGFTGPWHPDNYTVNLAQYYGVRTAVQEGNRAACIIEAGTITNAEDRALMDPDRVALAIGDALGITYYQESDMSAEAERKIQIIHAQLVGDETGAANTTPDQYPGWSQRGDLADYAGPLTLVGFIQAVHGRLAEVEAKVDELTDLVRQVLGAGITLRPSGEITVRAETT